MKRVVAVLIAVTTPAAAVPPGIANTPSAPPPPIAVTNSPPPIVAVPSYPGAPLYGAPLPPPPKPPSARIVRSPRPRAAAQDLVTPADYPPAALAMRAEGRVGFVVTVGTNGRVADCLIIRSSNSAVLDAATCRLMRSRGRFTPAMDSNGNPAEATVQQQVEWRLPEPLSCAGCPAPRRHSPPASASRLCAARYSPRRCRRRRRGH